MIVDNKLVQMLELLKITQAVDSIRVNANTQYQMDIVWNPHMNGGEFQGYTEESGYENYVQWKSAQDVARTVDPMYLVVGDWVPEDWDNWDETVDRIATELYDNKYHWDTITDKIITECATMLGICNHIEDNGKITGGAYPCDEPDGNCPFGDSNRIYFCRDNCGLGVDE